MFFIDTDYLSKKDAKILKAQIEQQAKERRMLELDYKARLKADMVAILEDLDLQIDESASYNLEVAKVQRLIRDKINDLKGNEDDNC